MIVHSGICSRFYFNFTQNFTASEWLTFSQRNTGDGFQSQILIIKYQGVKIHLRGS